MSFPAGVQINYPLSSIPPQCTMCYSVSYKTPTTSNDIQKCKGDSLLMGARRYDAPSLFIIAAYGSRSCVFTSSNSSSQVSDVCNGVYWYQTSGVSIGFSSSPIIDQYLTDISSESSSSADTRKLSWNLDNNVGGAQAGTMYNLNNDSIHEKVMFSCPSRILSLTSSSPNTLLNENTSMCSIRAGLTHLKSNIVGWACLNNTPLTPICSWEGVICVNSHIQYLSVSYFSFSGTLSSGIVSLSYLR
jgi:hypothetical protein